jgi:hypothetical protein
MLKHAIEQKAIDESNLIQNRSSECQRHEKDYLISNRTYVRPTEMVDLLGQQKPIKFTLRY